MIRISTVAASCLLLSAMPAAADTHPQGPAITTTEVAGNIYMLAGRGGNIGVSVGEDGVFVIDDQYAPQAPAVVEAIQALSDKPLRYVINTHWHGDHTGGNEHLSHRGAVIVAHDNVRTRMSSEQFIQAFGRSVPASPEAALPVITFSENISFYINGDVLEVSHPENAHTDGDSVIYFKQANVLHTGDIFFNGGYPFIDVSSGGSIRGLIKAVDGLLAQINEQTRIIPGHGPLANKADLKAYRVMLKDQADRVEALKRQGKTLEQVKALKPGKAYDKRLGNGFIKPEKWVELVYSSL